MNAKAKNRAKRVSRDGAEGGEGKANGPGRPAKITAAVVNEIGKLMARGVPEEYACALHGINPATFGPAVSRNEAFKDVLRRHHAQFMSDSLAIIEAGGERTTLTHQHTDDAGKTTTTVADKLVPWQGRAWILERRYKPFFTKTIVEKPQEGPGESGGLVLTPAEMEEMSAMTRRMVKALDKSTTEEEENE